MGFEILSHTADLRLRVWARSPEELFREALLAMMEIMKPKEPEGKYKMRTRFTRVQSPDVTSLLVDFLSEALSLAHTHEEIYTAVSFKKLTDTEAEARLEGFRVKEFAEDIKAATYHEADVKRNEKGEWETNLVFDI